MVSAIRQRRFSVLMVGVSHGMPDVMELRTVQAVMMRMRDSALYHPSQHVEVGHPYFTVFNLS